MRVVILTSIMAPHRIAPFNALASLPDIDLTVIYLAVTDPTRNWDTYAAEMGFRHVVLREHVRWRRGEAFVHLSSGLAAALRRAQPHVIVVGGWDQPSYLEAFLLGAIRRVPVIWWAESTLRDRRMSGGLAARAKAWLVSRAAVVVVPGVAARDYLVSMGAEPDHIWVAPNAVDNDVYRAASRSRENRRGPVRFLFVGRLESAKGILYLLDAWSGLRVPGYLTIAGDGPLAGRIARRVATTSLPPVELVGHLDRARLAGIYGEADVFVFPSVSDPWGLVLNEAMASGLPLITTDPPGAVDDLVTDGDNGLVVPPFASEGLLRAMDRLAADRTLRLSMGRRSAERIRAFEPSAWADGVVGAVHAATAGR